MILQEDGQPTIPQEDEQPVIPQEAENGNVAPGDAVEPGAMEIEKNEENQEDWGGEVLIKDEDLNGGGGGGEEGENGPNAIPDDDDDDDYVNDSAIFERAPENSACYVRDKKYLKMPWDLDTWKTTIARFTKSLKRPPRTAEDLNALTRTSFFTAAQEEYSEEVSAFLGVYPEVCALMLSAKETFDSKRVPLLQTRTCGTTQLTRKQAACLVALSFFGDYAVGGETYNIFSVRHVLAIPGGDHVLSIGVCYMNYLTNIGNWLKSAPECDDILNEKVTYMRHSIEPFRIDAQRVPLCSIKIVEQGSLSNSKANYHVDFANKFIGGGALQGGCVQEELMFAMQPELACAMAFMEVMDPSDAIRIDNTLCHSYGRGYAATFKFDKNALPAPKLARRGGRVPRVIAMDAIIQGYDDQFGREVINRDIHKAFVCFQLGANPERLGVEKDVEATVATGNWGCGAFGGNHELKFMEQWIAASMAGITELEYYTYQSQEMNNVVQKYAEIKEKYINTKKLYSGIVKCKTPGTVVSVLTRTFIDSILSILKK